MAQKLYVSRDNASLTVSMAAGDVVFQGHSLMLDDEDEKQAAQIAELNEAIATNPSISSLITLVDQEEAERVAREHLEQERKEQELQQSLRGPTSAQALKDLEAGGEFLPPELRGTGGTGAATDGMKLSELMRLAGQDKPEAEGGV